MGNGSKVPAIAIGDLHLSFDSSVLVLKDVLYVPEFRRNIISVSKLYTMDGYKSSFDSSVSIMKDGDFICGGSLSGSLYTTTCESRSSVNVASSSNPKKRKESSKENQTYLWHLRLGHINLNRIKRLVEYGSLESLQVEPFPTCESCLEGKMVTRPFKAKGYRAT